MLAINTLLLRYYLLTAIIYEHITNDSLTGN